MPAAAASLLPCISSASSLAPSTSSRLQRPLGGPRAVPPNNGSSAAGAALRGGTTVHSPKDDDNADETGNHYDGEYDRLVFSPIHPSHASLAASFGTSNEDRGDGADSTVAPDSLVLEDSEHHYSESFSPGSPRGPPSRGFITASQATAALERLPVLSISPRRQAASSAVTTPISAQAAAVSTFSSCRPCSKTATLLTADAVTLQPDAWWSTLDGTLSATNTLLDNESQRIHHVGKTPPPASFHPLLAPSLNDTLGRADRAAIVLSMRLSHQASSSTGEAIAAGVDRAKDGSAGRSTKGEEATAAAVAALAMRLSRATAGGSLARGLSGAASTRLSDASRGSAGQNTLQGLRDALRLTQPSAEELDISAPYIASHWLGASEEGHGPLSSSDVRSKPAPKGTTRASRAHRQTTEEVAHPHGAQEGSAGVIKRGGGTQLGRGASARTCADDTDRAPAPAAALLSSARALLQSAPLHEGAAEGRVGAVMQGLHPAASVTATRAHNTRTSSVGFTTDSNAGAREGAGARTGNQDGCARAASHALSPPSHPHAVAGLAFTAELPRSFPWQQDCLTLEEMKRRYGAQSAVHTRRRGQRYHSHRRSEGPSATDHSPRSSYAAPLALLASPVASSVPTSDFSAASLTSSIFMRELGEGEAARHMLAKHRWRLAAPREAVSSASGDAAQRSPLRSRRGTGATQVHLPHSATSKEAAAKAYREQQLRLYSSHLATPSTLLTNESFAAEQGLLDVDSLLRDTQRHTAGASMSPVRCAEASGAGAASASVSGVAATTKRVPASKPVAGTAPRLSALDRALQARAALLRRHVQGRPAWKRQLHQVRQWCDRTRVMVRFDNGVCVEQMAAGPSHRTIARQHQRQSQQRAMTMGSRTGSRDAQAGSETSGVDLGDDAGWQHFVYADDPATAHDAVMKKVAEEEHEVQRQNVLQQCRERQHLSFLVESFMGGPRGGPVSSPEQSVGPGKAAAQATCRGSFGHRADSRRAAQALSPRTADAGRERLRIMSPLHGLGTKPELLQEHQHSSQLAMSATDDLASKEASATLGHVSPSSLQQPLVSIHANLCARLETWGTDVADNEEALPGRGSTAEDTAALPPAAAAGAVCDDYALPLAWQGAWRGSVPPRGRSMLLSDHSEESVRRRSVAEVKGDPTVSVQGTAERHNFASPLVHLQRTSLGQTVSATFTRAERDLLSFVLTCASGGGDVEHLSVLLSLCHRHGRKSTAVEWHLSSTASAAGLAATQLPPALVALRTMLDQWTQAPVCDGAAVDTAVAQESASCGAVAARECHVSVKELPFSAPCDVTEVAITQEAAGVRRDADADAGSPRVDHMSGKAKGPAAAPTSESTPPPSWNALVTALLSGYSALDLSFLRQLHLLLWEYKAKEHGGLRITVADAPEGVVTSTPPPPPISTAHRSQGAPPAVLPLALHLSVVQEARMAASTDLRSSDSSPRTLSTVVVDAADLLNAIAATPLLRWLCDASRQSPTSSWAELVARLPEACAQDWQNALARCIEAASSGAHPHENVSARVSFVSGESLPSRASLRAGLTAATASSPYAGKLESFLCDTASALESAAWRQHRLHSVLHRASLHAEQDRRAANSAAATGATTVASLAVDNTWDAVPAAFPCVGGTPYLPGDEARARYPLNMRNLYLMSALAAEDVDARIVPQLREARVQYADALRAAADAATLASAPCNPSMSNVSLMAFSRPTASLPLALQQRVHLDKLFQIEQRFFSFLWTLWNSEQSVFAFNQHVAPFNAFTAAEQRCWGPLYRSSLKVAYFVCEELVEKGMENVSAELLPFVSIVAAFAGCRGGHRELLSKLKTIMLELTERAKKVQVPLESLSWQGKRSQVLEEAIAASKIASRRAGAVVSCLTTEADVVSLPLAELATPALRLIHVPPLSPPPHGM
ncbi:conserved hypothetical protein [Leishmania major strain Friedlin]|uniref:Uncharacterized protein n=1 Tax=Leishmania major TaxID=5664 RepID=Q4Q986_LEIMA|nr:conserved hypothetical protein [Leishmania major strain Friedlin]CAG9576429.1 hypothetical_protein_-_conserved [Leishmania major strain Friedlin]CAJ05085.1 conserved hypothetical protein [Leishmania major strain Friedlin]|eukprot:XP_001684112.1 conserved hypothetical protein [Leishmania major strain Friedlin]